MGIVSTFLAAPATSAPEEGKSDFRDDDYISLSTGMLGRELTEEEQLALVLKASTDRGLEERMARATSLIIYKPACSLPVSLILFLFYYQSVFDIHTLIVLSAWATFSSESTKTLGFSRRVWNL